MTSSTSCIMDCSEMEYFDNGKCILCLKCGPGEELSQECGFGSGGEAHCLKCKPRHYKDDWGHHDCKPCLSCKLLNRYQKANCTAGSNAVCGDCLPGYYRKIRIDGLHDMECMPCSHSSSSDPQCSSSSGIGVVKVWSSKTPPQDAAIASVICAAFVTMVIALSLLCYVYRRRTFIRNLGQGCFGSQNIDQTEVGYSANTVENTRTPSPKTQDKDKAEGRSDSLATDDSPASLRSFVQAHTFPGTVVKHPVLKPQHVSSSSETQPLMRDSTCSNCSSGCQSQRSSSFRHSAEYPSESACIQPVVTAVPANQYCASDQHERHQHAPVECTELDFNSPAGLENSGLDAEIIGPAETSIRCMDNVSVEQNNVLFASCTQNIDSCAKANQQSCINNCSNLDSVQNIVKRSCDLMHGVRLWSLPKALVQSLSLKLDPSFPGVKNYRQVGLELGVPEEVINNIAGFENVFNYLSSCTLNTVPDLVKTLHYVQRFDALFMLCEYATQSQSGVC
ncbi:tumor necrosis factor receptor superfamily member 27 [Lepisosteus oculatus]|uniref:Ectodysplasin A2 receptor n=1 Tax=Lepisosteus oculatus TaxID=7918 RepID=W5NBP3_LEPOC|nr:PREDICTED: tumor necrosis factor receptor superfamily member 27 [Lepisosteus oculatus]XP_015206802.1 PREDICTED: tumor necrosis factor receptor superfamily member 27 [Lepisosteus oculatus]XP_015206803.1 PREDICTED: tumor necrosis factor receptor superfamily member 27 [Lepisosteus oculatus]XP_015206804.1 PREDICTED: tumor necrosis factor receptor superfamily member 27 [Lepisosteus oculatus]XP_015206806.1 PREDICTED: tumor necrosis factor receptor superfamily member 27 [Lepisosteus oculatus]